MQQTDIKAKSYLWTLLKTLKVLHGYKYILIRNETVNEAETYLFNMMFKEIYSIYKTPNSHLELL